MAAVTQSSNTPSFDDSVEEKGHSTGSFDSAPAKFSWFRSPLTQAVIVGLCAFMSPGIWNGMNALGAGGAQSPYLVNAANALVFGLMVVTCLFASSIVNRVGYRWALVLGAAGYSPYAAALYTNKLYGNEWFVLLGSVFCGLSAGLFWGVEGAIILGYPAPEDRGKFLALWLGFRNGGTLLAGTINLALNATTAVAGSVGSSTYLVFIAIQAAAPAVAVLLSNPSQVTRRNGTKVQMANSIGFANEMREMWQLMKRPEVLWLVPISLYAQWSASYAGTYLSLYFSVRARALASFVIPIISLLANTALGYFLDNTSIRKNVRSKVSYIFIMTGIGAIWIGFLVTQIRFINTPPAKIDWLDGHRFAGPWTLYVIYYTFYFLIQNELYWIISTLAREPKELIRLSSFLRGLESAGSACGYGISARKTLPKTIPLGINVGLFGISTLTAWMTVKEIGTSIDYTFASDVKDSSETQLGLEGESEKVKA